MDPRLMGIRTNGTGFAFLTPPSVAQLAMSSGSVGGLTITKPVFCFRARLVDGRLSTTGVAGASSGVKMVLLNCPSLAISRLAPTRWRSADCWHSRNNIKH